MVQILVSAHDNTTGRNTVAVAATLTDRHLAVLAAILDKRGLSPEGIAFWLRELAGEELEAMAEREGL